MGSPFLEDVLIPTAQLVKAGYAVISQMADETGEGALLAQGRARALKVEGSIFSGTEAIGN